MRPLLAVLLLAVLGRAAAEPPPFYPDQARHLVWRDAAGKEHAITTAVDWEKRRAHIILNMQEVMGPLPNADCKVALKPKVVEETAFPKPSQVHHLELRFL